MKLTVRCFILAAYPLYFFLAVIGLLRLDVPSLVDSFLPRPLETPYKLAKGFLKFETMPNVLRQEVPYEAADIIWLQQVPALKGVDPRVYFRDPTFHAETTNFRPHEEYEQTFAYSVHPKAARVFLFGDSYLVSADYKPLSFLLNEECRIPTWRRTYGEWGSMETVYSFLAETPTQTLRGRYLIFAISEGYSVWVNRQLNGMPMNKLIQYVYRKATYFDHEKSGIGGDFDRRYAISSPTLLPSVRKLSMYTTPEGNILREDPSHFNPVLFEYQGKQRAVAFYSRNLAHLTWSEPYLNGGTPAISLENWIARIGKLARKKGAIPVVLYIPTKLSTYWPLLGPILDYGKMYAFVSGHGHTNKAVRSPDDLRKILPLGIRAWRDLVTETCRREGVGIIDLTDPFREATLRGEVVYLDFGTHWNQHGIEIAKIEIENIVLGGKRK
jgi:hypothetical protein